MIVVVWGGTAAAGGVAPGLVAANLHGVGAHGTGTAARVMASTAARHDWEGVVDGLKKMVRGPNRRSFYTQQRSHQASP